MAVVIPILRSQCKVLNRWNGSSNDAPPAGWDAVSFDDSAWPDASSFSPTQSGIGAPPVAGGDEFKRYQNGSTLTPAGAAAPIGNGAEAIAPWTVPPSATASFLIRWRFTGTSMPTDTIAHMYQDTVGTGFGANTGTAVMNGSSGNMFNALAWATRVSEVTAGLNVAAFAPQCNWHSSLVAGWYTLALTSATATFPTPTPKHALMVSIVG